MAKTAEIAPDNLTLDTVDATRAGMSYGQYKAVNPKTRAANEARMAAAKPPVSKPARVFEFTCRNCGEKFRTTNSMRRYCGSTCSMRKRNATYREKHKKDEEAKNRD